jgi:hypothetical protein
MSEEINKVEAEEIPKNLPNQISLIDLINIGKPILGEYFKSQEEQNKQNLEYDLKFQQIQSKQNLILIRGLFFLLFVVLLICGYLYIQNRDSSATNLIQIVAAFGAGAFGGYGWATSKYKKNKKEE